MAIKRIRYTKMNDTKFISVKTFNHSTNGARYQAVLDTAESQWLVVDADSGLVAASGRVQHLHKMKIAVKEALAVLGIEFVTEDRYSKSDASADIAKEQMEADAEQTA